MPLVDDHYARFPLFEDETRDVRILGGNAGGRVDHQQGHIGALDAFE